jgi:photosystem II stability/assembly factor-like uncharacterized protein
MSLLNVCKRLMRRPRSFRRGPRRSPVRRQPYALALEPLEHRLCPSSWTSIGPYGSPTRGGIVIDPSHPDTIYTASEGAGVRKSTDGGTNWSAVNHGITNNTTVALAMDPKNPQTLYRGAELGLNALGPTGVWKSTNGGESWAPTGLTTAVQYLAIDPNDSQTIYSQNSKSTDGGNHWQPNGVGFSVGSIAFDPLHPGTLYAGTYGGADERGLFKSTDGGGHWSLALPSPTGVSVALDATNPQIVYAGDADGIFKSYDGGDTWFQPIGFHPQALASLVVDPTHPHTLYAGTLDGGVFQSTDGAASWHYSGLSTELILSLAIDPTNSDKVYAGTLSGPYASSDGGSSWTALDDQLRHECACYGNEGVTVDPRDSSVIYFTTLDGGGLVTRDGAASWSPLTAGLATRSPKHFTFAPSDPNIVYAGSNNYVGSAGVFKSTDGGQTWSNKSLGNPGIYVWTLDVDPNDANTIYADTSGLGLFKSTDGGDSWLPVNEGLPANASIGAVVVDPYDSNTVYVALTGGPGVFKSTDGGNHWSQKLGGIPLGDETLTLDPQNSQIIYLGTASQGVFKSTDGGETWHTINDGLGNNLRIARDHGVLVDPTDSDTVYVGTEGGGVFASSDGGEHWTPLNDGLPNPIVFAMAMDPQDPHTIYAGTVPVGTVPGSLYVLHIPPRAVVQSVLVNDGSVQRSMVTSLTVTFSTVVTLDPGAFELLRQGGGLVSLNVAASVVAGHTVATVTFTGADLVAGSLADGHYTLTIHADRVHDELGRILQGGDHVEPFFRLFGDADGDGHLGLRDLLSLVSTLGKHAGDPGYLWYFDYNGDGAVDLADLAQFLRRFGR